MVCYSVDPGFTRQTRVVFGFNRGLLQIVRLNKDVLKSTKMEANSTTLPTLIEVPKQPHSVSVVNITA